MSTFRFTRSLLAGCAALLGATAGCGDGTAPFALDLLSFGEDAAGEIYMLSAQGRLYRIIARR